MPEQFDMPLRAGLNPTLFEALTVSTTAVTLTVANLGQGQGPESSIAPAIAVFITVEAQPVRFRLDGTAPTSSVGHLLSAGDTIFLTGAKTLRDFKVIRSGASDATLHVTYFGS